MKISTKGRYALRVMIDIAQHADENEYISLKDIADRQDISMKYLEIIVAMLNKASLVDSRRGKTGGYRLAKSAREYSVGEIIELTEGSMAPVACLEHSECTCERAGECITLPLWKELDSMIADYLAAVSLQDLLDGSVPNYKEI